MAPYEQRYSSDAKEAVCVAWNDKQIRPAARVRELAASGLLTRPDGSRIDPFDIPEGSIRSFAKEQRRRRAGRHKTELAKVGARDAIEALRVRLVSIADRELAVLERSKAGSVDLPRLRDVVRCVREAAALPGPNDPRPPVPGNGPDGIRQGRKGTGALAGPLLRAHRAGKVPGNGDGPAEAEPPTAETGP